MWKPRFFQYLTLCSLALAAPVGEASSQEFRVFKTQRGMTPEQYDKILGNFRNSGITEVGGPEKLTDPNIVTPPSGATPLQQSREQAAQVLADPRIVGGRRAKPGEVPWQVYLTSGLDPEPIRQPFCGGSIIRPAWILTAAHCMEGVKQPGEIDVVSGTTYSTQPTGDRIKVKQIFINPTWNAKTYDGDVALLQLERPVKYGTPIAPAKQGLNVPANTTVSVSGWGALYMGGPVSAILMIAGMPSVSRDECKRAYGDSVLPTMICAGSRDGGLDACQGDSGGPETTNVSGTTTQIGIVSWGKGCALRGKYGVYTSVAAYSSWISNTAYHVLASENALPE